MKQYTIPFVIYLTLSACAGGGANVRAPGEMVKQSYAACAEATGSTEMLAIEVPAANNALSNKMMVAAMRISGSNTVDTLVKLLPQSERKTLMVVRLRITLCPTK